MVRFRLWFLLPFYNCCAGCVLLTAVDNPVCRLHYWFCFHLEYFSVCILVFCATNLLAHQIPSDFFAVRLSIRLEVFHQCLLNSTIRFPPIRSIYEQWACFLLTIDVTTLTPPFKSLLAIIVSVVDPSLSLSLSSLMLRSFHFYILYLCSCVIVSLSVYCQLSISFSSSFSFFSFLFCSVFTLCAVVAPENVKIRVEPAELVPGVEATLICDSSSSNPPAKLSFWKDGIPVEGINNASKQGLWGGTVSSLELKINVTQEMNGIVYTCQSNNEALQRSVHESVALQVLCKYRSSTRHLIHFPCPFLISSNTLFHSHFSTHFVPWVQQKRVEHRFFVIQ